MVNYFCPLLKSNVETKLCTDNCCTAVLRHVFKAAVLRLSVVEKEQFLDKEFRQLFETF